MAARPGDETEQTGGVDPRRARPGRGDHPDRPSRDQAIEALKAAFVEGRLGKDEFDQRVGQALAAYAQLDAVTADIPHVPPHTPSHVPPLPSHVSPTIPSPAGEPQVTREAYNKGLVARGTFGAAGGIMLVSAVVVTAVTGNPFTGFMAGAALGVVMAVVLGSVLTLIMWVMESQGGRKRAPGPPGPPRTARVARAKAVRRPVSPPRADPRADPPGLPRQPPRGPGHTAETSRHPRPILGCSQA